jgi:serine protease
MKRLLHLPTALLTCLLFLLTDLTHAAPLAGASRATIADSTDQVIVKYRQPAVSAARIGSMSTRILHTTGLTLSPLGHTHNQAQILKLERRIPLDELQGVIEEIKTDPEVEYAEPDLIMVPLFTPNDPRYGEQWHYFEEMAGITLPEAWDRTQGLGSVIAVIDTGYRPHQDLLGNLLPGYDMISAPATANDGDGRDDDARDTGDYAPNCDAPQSSWHGTHVAGTAAAVGDNGTGVTGVAFRSKILPVRVLGKCGGYLSDITDAIVWASGFEVSATPTNPYPAHVINLSLGGKSTSCTKTMQDAIDTARLGGTTVVVAAGNDASDSGNSTPANCEGVIVVAAHTRSGELADYSNFGDGVDISAPGSDVLSTHNDGLIDPGADAYRYASGTSMATPHVSGVAALLYSVDPELTPDQVERIIKESARPFATPCDGCGSGILDAAAAVAKASEGNIPDLVLLKNGVAETAIEGSRGDILRFAIDLPNGATDLHISMSGGSGDSDLYVRFGAEPTFTEYDCRPYLYGNEESCHIPAAKAGRYYLLLHGYSDFSDVTLSATYTAEGGNPTPIASFENPQDYPIPEQVVHHATSPITVEQSGESNRIVVEVDLKYTHIRELMINLLAPNGHRYTLKALGVPGTADQQQRYTLKIPGKIAGVWKLRIWKFGIGGSGFLDSWRIVFY